MVCFLVEVVLKKQSKELLGLEKEARKLKK